MIAAVGFSEFNIAQSHRATQAMLTTDNHLKWLTPDRVTNSQRTQNKMPRLIPQLPRLFLLTLLVLHTLPAIANDSTARIGAGGIILVKNRHIRMLSEHLTISQAKINVHYRFLNEGPSAIDTVVAFPLPVYHWDPEERAQIDDLRPIASLSVFADGQPVKIQMEVKALIGKRDITAQLRRIGLTYEQIDSFAGKDAYHEYLDISAKQKARLASLGAWKDDVPTWSVADTAYWHQIFPAGREITVDHSYQPFVGTIFSNFSLERPYSAPEDIPVSSDWNSDRNTDQSCLDEGSRKVIVKRLAELFKQGAKEIYVELYDVEYILGTARNWKGPISDFTLDVVKGSPDQIVSLCFPGKPTRINDTTLRFHHVNFVPQDRVIVNFYDVKATR
jgi:hypothetical protein